MLPCQILYVKPPVPHEHPQGKPQREQAQRSLPPAVSGSLKHESHDNGQHKEPVRRHDIHLFDAETEPFVYQQVESHKRQCQPQQAVTAPEPHADNEQHYQQSLCHIVENIAVMHNFGPVITHVSQQIILMKLQRFTKKVFNH